MLVGALCRDVLHREEGHNFVLRRTGDLDLALAVDGWERYDEVIHELPGVSASTQIRYDLAGMKVDLVPFGGVEHPDGAVPLSAGAAPLDVLGFRDVWEDAREVTLGDGLAIRLPTVPGYVALKLASRAARSTFGEHKDAGDLACASYWYLPGWPRRGHPSLADHTRSLRVGMTLRASAGSVARDDRPV